MVKLKVCGITKEEDLKKAIALHFDYTGFIFYPPSPRYVSITKATHLVQKIDFGNTLKVGVFVDSPLEEIREAIETLKLEVIQLHGKEDQKMINELKKTNVREIWKVFLVRDQKTIDQTKSYQNDYFLIDYYHQTLKGGTGLSIANNLLTPWLNLDKKIILAGGLNLTKAKIIIEENQKGNFLKLPYAFDFNSGLEEKPGEKNHQKMEELMKFFQRIK